MRFIQKLVVLLQSAATALMRKWNLSPELVLTPGGLRSKSTVHLIRPSEVFDQTDGRLRIIDRTGKIVKDFGAAKPTHTRAPPLSRSTPSHWITYAQLPQLSGSPISKFRTTWVVPPPPSTDSGQTLYLFNAIQNFSSTIWQPVLQWGVSGAGGGNYWSVASWCASGIQASVYSTPVPVNVGSTLIGVIELTGQSGNVLDYHCYFEGIPGTDISVATTDQPHFCFETLEAYGITADSDYPPVFQTSMKEIELSIGAQQVPLHWSPTNIVTNYGQHYIVVSNASPGGEVDLYYRNLFVWSNGDIGEGVGAVSWLIGDVNGDGRAEIIQLWNNGGALAMIVYGWSGTAMTKLWGNGDMGEGVGAVSWQIADVNGDGRAELVQLWNNGGALAMIVYGWSGTAMTKLWGNGDMGEGVGAVSWQIGDVNGDGRAELVQLWNNGGALAMIVYGWSGTAMMKLWGNGDMGQGVGAISWQIADVNGDGRAEIVQLWNNGSAPGWTDGGALGMVVYGWSDTAMTTLVASNNVGQGTGAITWLTGHMQGGARDEIMQLWNNGGKLGMILYSPWPVR